MHNKPIIGMGEVNSNGMEMNMWSPIEVRRGDDRNLPPMTLDTH